MIAAQDLMVGDWVMVAECVADAHFRDYPDKIESIRDGLVGLESDGLETIIERIAPIPLTAEILKKNGFEKVNGEYQDVFYCCDGLDLLIDDRLEPWGYTLYGVLELPIRYVHELQHALRLCGIEKEITI